MGFYMNELSDFICGLHDQDNKKSSLESMCNNLSNELTVLVLEAIHNQKPLPSDIQDQHLLKQLEEFRNDYKILVDQISDEKKMQLQRIWRSALGQTILESKNLSSAEKLKHIKPLVKDLDIDSQLEVFPEEKQLKILEVAESLSKKEMPTCDEEEILKCCIEIAKDLEQKSISFEETIKLLPSLFAKDKKDEDKKWMLSNLSKNVVMLHEKGVSFQDFVEVVRSLLRKNADQKDMSDATEICFEAREQWNLFKDILKQVRVFFTEDMSMVQRQILIVTYFQKKETLEEKGIPFAEIVHFVKSVCLGDLAFFQDFCEEVCKLQKTWGSLTEEEKNELLRLAIEKNPTSLELAGKDFFLQKVKENGLNLLHASFSHREDLTICQAAFDQNKASLQYADERFVLQKVQEDGLNLQYVASWNRAAFAQIAFTQNKASLQYADERFVLQKVQEDGLNLQYASEADKDKDSIVRAANAQNPEALQYASARLRERLGSILSDTLSYSTSNWFYVSIEDIDSNPSQVLCDLYPKMKDHFPKIRYLNSPGIDSGGLSRDFVSKILRAIYDVDKKHLPMKQENGKIIPLIEDGKKDQVICYQAIGAIFAYALQKEPPILTGNYHHPLFFLMLHSLTATEIDDLPKTLDKYEDIPQKIIEKLFKIYAQTYLKISEEEIQELLQGTVPQSLKDSLGYSDVEDFFSPEFKQMALACLVIAQSMRSHVSNWDEIKGKTSEDLASNIEGTLKKEDVLKALTYSDATNLNEEEKKFSKAIQVYVTRWCNECSDKDLEKFVYAITGSLTLTPTVTLKILLHNEPQMSYHTCFNRLDLPIGYLSYEDFKLALESSFTEGMQAS
jgi:hypothetical protein